MASTMGAGDGVIGIGLGCVAAVQFGAPGCLYASALAILAAQVLLTSSECLGLCVAVLSSGAQDCCRRSHDGDSGCHIMDHRRVAPTVAPSCSVIGPMTTALARLGRGHATSACPLCYPMVTTVDPAVRTDGHRGDDRPDTVLNEQGRPIRWLRASARPPAVQREAQSAVATGPSGDGSAQAYGTRSRPRLGRRIASNGQFRRSGSPMQHIHQSTSSATAPLPADDAAPQRIRPDSREC
jgi:hypothetical protein